MQVNVTKLRNHLSEYLSAVQQGSEILVVSHGKVIARITPSVDVQQQAIARLKEIRKHCKIGDIISPTGEVWESDK